MKRLLFIIVLISLLIGCGNQVTNSKPQIGLIISSLENPFFTELAEQMALEAQKRDYDLIVLDSNDDVTKELEYVQKMIEQTVDVIILNPVDVSKSSEGVLLANEKRIPVLTLDRTVENGEIVSNVTSDNYMGGQLVGELLLKKINYSGKLFILEGILETSANSDRIAGLLNAISAYDVEIVGRTAANFSRDFTYDIVVQMINASLKPDVIFAANDEMALGAIDALLDNNQTMMVYGYDGNKEAINAVVDGYLSGTIAQQPNLMAQTCLELVNNILNAQPVEKETKVAVKVITLDQ